MKRPKLVFIFTFIVLFVEIYQVANGHPVRSKRSGISDQRLAELETLIALSNMRGRIRNAQVAYGVIDPDKIGKRKRSFIKDEDLDGVKLRGNHLQRILNSENSDEDNSINLLLSDS